MNDSPPQTIRISLPETQLDITATGSRVECETGELVMNKTDRELQASSTRKRRREQQSLESRDGSSHHREHSTKKSKSKQNENDNPCAHLQPLQDYLSPGLDGMPFFQSCLRSQIELGWKWCSVESSEYITPVTLSQACAEGLFVLVTVQGASLPRLATISRIRRIIFIVAYTTQVLPIDLTPHAP